MNPISRRPPKYQYPTPKAPKDRPVWCEKCQRKVSTDHRCP